MTALASTFLIGSSSFFHLTRTNIKAWMSLKFCRIRPRTYELTALEGLENSPQTYNGRNVVTTLVLSILNGSSSFLQATRKPIISRMGWKFSRIRPRTYELTALEGLENSP